MIRFQEYITFFVEKRDMLGLFEELHKVYIAFICRIWVKMQFESPS